jgi:nitrogen fixation/metabolism regulation signal transduction histidine kinase
LIERQRAYLEAVLANLSSGVISLGQDAMIRAVNRTARQSLGVDINSYLGKDMQAIVADHAFLKPFVEVIERYRETGSESWQEEVSLFGMNGRQVLMCRGTALQSSGHRSNGLVVLGRSGKAAGPRDQESPDPHTTVSRTPAAPFHGAHGAG